MPLPPHAFVAVMVNVLVVVQLVDALTCDTPMMTVLQLLVAVTLLDTLVSDGKFVGLQPRLPPPGRLVNTGSVLLMAQV